MAVPVIGSREQLEMMVVTMHTDGWSQRALCSHLGSGVTGYGVLSGVMSKSETPQAR